jgi:hypothetical protein
VLLNVPDVAQLHNKQYTGPLPMQSASCREAGKSRQDESAGSDCENSAWQTRRKNGAKFSEAAQRDAAHRQPQTPAGPLHRTSGTSHPDRQEQTEHSGVIGYLRGR